ncbi:MAG: insulinase family protein, partial [Desulfobacteraceae bacterium]|nr:insulinase family protein [Desulfobacteraceae bacterium]
SLLSRILSEKLRIIIREKLSASYSPYVYNDPSLAYDHYGVLQAVVNVDPEKSTYIAAEIKKIMADVLQKGVTQKELDSVLKPILNHLKIIRKTNGYWLNSVMAGSSDHPEKFEWANTMVEVYSSATTDEMERLAKKYLNMDQSALIVIQPLK